MSLVHSGRSALRPQPVKVVQPRLTPMVYVGDGVDMEDPMS